MEVAEATEQLHQFLICEQAHVDGDELVRGALDERRATAMDLEVEAIPIVIGLTGGDDRPDVDVIDPAEMTELTCDGRSLPCELGGIVGVLPGAASAGAEVFARGFDPVGRSGGDGDERRPFEAFLGLDDLDVDGVSRDRSRDEHRLSVAAADAVAAVGHGVYVESEEVGHSDHGRRWLRRPCREGCRSASRRSHRAP